jgi:hypothetical protein
MTQNRKIKGYGRGELDVQDGEEEFKGQDPRELEEWYEFCTKPTEFFSNERADDLLASMDAYAEQQGYKYEVSEKKYKLKV